MRLKRLFVRGASQRTLEKIEEGCAEAGITSPIWTRYFDRVTSFSVQRLTFVELQTSEDERLLKDLSLVRDLRGQSK